MPPTSSVQFRKRGTADTFNVPSPDLWNSGGAPGVAPGCPWDRIINGELAGSAIYDTFDLLPLAPTLTTQIAYGQYKAFATSGETISVVSSINSVDVPGGALQLTVGSSANSASLAGAFPTFRLSGDKTIDGPLWFECSIALKSVATAHQGLFVGLAETSLWTLATGVPFSSNVAAITNSAAAIGFFKPTANTTTMSTVTSDRATSFTNVGSADVTGLAAFTFTKLGFLYDPFNPTKAVRFFQDNVELTNSLSQTTLAATTNLKANSMNVIIATVGAASVSSDLLFMKWWRCAQLQA